MKDEIIFYGKFKDLNESNHYDLTGVSEKQVVKVLTGISEKIERLGYIYSGISVDTLDDFISENAKQYKSAEAFLEEKTKAMNKAIKSSIPTSKHRRIAESYTLNKIFRMYKVPYKILPNEIDASPPKKINDIKQDDQIVFIGHYKKWAAIKKLTITNAEDWEISGVLSSINFTMVNATFRLMDVKESKLEKRKHKWGTVLEVLNKAKTIKNKWEKALFISRNLEIVNYSPYLQPSILVKAYRDIKPPRPRGRLPK